MNSNKDKTLTELEECVFNVIHSRQHRKSNKDLPKLIEETLKDITLTELLAVSRCRSNSTKLTDKLRELIHQDHEVYKKQKIIEAKRKAFNNDPNKFTSINSDISIPSPVFTENESIHIKDIDKNNKEISKNQKQPIEFESYSNSPKVRKKQELNFSLEKMDELIMNSNNNSQDSSSPQHNFLVTLCHQNKNLKSFQSPKVTTSKKNIKKLKSYQIKDHNLTPPNEIYEEYSLAMSESVLSNKQESKLHKHQKSFMKIKSNIKPKTKKIVESHLSLDRSTLMEFNDQTDKSDTTNKKHIEVKTDNPINYMLKSSNSKQKERKPKQNVKFNLNCNENKIPTPKNDTIKILEDKKAALAKKNAINCFESSVPSRDQKVSINRTFFNSKSQANISSK